MATPINNWRAFFKLSSPVFSWPYQYPSLSELTEDSLNELSCDDLREICKRDELRTRGRKSELVERILKKKNALI